MFAGPIEFSGPQVALILLLAFALVMIIPLTAGTIASVVYRRKTPEAERENYGTLKVFILWTALGFLGQIAVGYIIATVSQLF